MMRILVIEDDALVAQTVRRSLVAAGHDTILTFDRQSARGAIASQTFDAVLLDINLPDGSGLDLVAELRSIHPGVPVIMLTGLSSTGDVIRGFEAGADDYITKPFDLRELQARLRAVTRRAANPRERVSFEDIALDRLRREVRANGERLRLTPKQFGLLERLMLEEGDFTLRRVLLEDVWGYEQDPVTNVIDVQITYLRNKLREAGSRVRITNIRGLGFRLESAHDQTVEA